MPRANVAIVCYSMYNVGGYSCLDSQSPQVSALSFMLFPGDLRASVLSGVLFAVHPVHVEASRWVGRGESFHPSHLLNSSSPTHFANDLQASCVHVCLQAVTGVVGRCELLCALFSILGFMAYTQLVLAMHNGENFQGVMWALFFVVRREGVVLQWGRG